MPWTMVRAADQSFVYENIMVYTCINLQRDNQAEFMLVAGLTPRCLQMQVVTGPDIQSS